MILFTTIFTNTIPHSSHTCEATKKYQLHKTNNKQNSSRSPFTSLHSVPIPVISIILPLIPPHPYPTLLPSHIRVLKFSLTNAQQILIIQKNRLDQVATSSQDMSETQFSTEKTEQNEKGISVCERQKMWIIATCGRVRVKRLRVRKQKKGRGKLKLKRKTQRTIYELRTFRKILKRRKKFNRQRRFFRFHQTSSQTSNQGISLFLKPHPTSNNLPNPNITPQNMMDMSQHSPPQNKKQQRHEKISTPITASTQTKTTTDQKTQSPIKQVSGFQEIKQEVLKRLEALDINEEEGIVKDEESVNDFEEMKKQIEKIQKNSIMEDENEEQSQGLSSIQQRKQR